MHEQQQLSNPLCLRNKDLKQNQTAYIYLLQEPFQHTEIELDHTNLWDARWHLGTVQLQNRQIVCKMKVRQKERVPS